MDINDRDPVAPLFLRVGDWNPDRPLSNNYATGEAEIGLSVYALDDAGAPLCPPDGEWAAEDLADRIASDANHYLVQGTVIGTGHDGEPLLEAPVAVGVWPDDLDLETGPKPL